MNSVGCRFAVKQDNLTKALLSLACAGQFSLWDGGTQGVMERAFLSVQDDTF